MDKAKLKILLTEDIEKVFEELKSLISADSELFDDVIIALARYKDLLRADNNGMLSIIEKNIELNKVRGSVLSIINFIERIL